MLYSNINRTHHASDFYAQLGGTFLLMGYFTYQYPKQILTMINEKCPGVAINTEEYTTYGFRNCLGCILKNSFSFNGPIISELEDDFDDEVDSDNIEREYTFENWARAVKKYSSILASDIYENGDYISLEKCRGENNSLCEKIVLDSLPHCKDDTYFGIDFYYLDEEIGSPWDEPFASPLSCICPNSDAKKSVK